MRDDASVPEAKGGATESVAVGPYLLKIGDPAGIVLEPASTISDASALSRALAKERKRQRSASSEAIEVVVDDASAVMAKVEHAVSLCTELLSGRHDLQSASDEVGALIGLLQRLDQAGRWQEALRVARCLSVLAALVGRWIELLRSLRIALHAAEQLGDRLHQAWALHELGTLHLAAGRHPEADNLLEHARDIRGRCGDRRGRAITNRNLQVLCSALRRRLHRRWHERLPDSLGRSPVFALIAAGSIFVVGGVAGATIGHSVSSGGGPFHRAAVNFSFTPRAPHTGQRVMFTAAARDSQDPVASYTWRWGDGDPAGHRVQSHVYRASRTYKATLIVRDASGRVTGRASHLIVVQRPPFPGPNAAFSFEPRSPVVNEHVSFDARSSFDTSATIADYTWEFGDGQTAHDAVVSHSFSTARSYLVTLKVADAKGRRGSLTQTILVASGHTGKAQARVGIVCPPSSIMLEEAVPVSGSIMPPRPGASLTVTYTSPSGQRLAAPAQSDPAGAYEASQTPTEAGQWSVQSSWAGDGEYLPGISEACPFSVETGTVDKVSEQKATEESQREKRELKEQATSEPALDTQPAAPPSVPEEPTPG